MAAFGLTREEVLGRDLVRLFPGVEDILLALEARVLAGQEVAVPRLPVSVRGREIWWSGKISPVPAENGGGLVVTLSGSGVGVFYAERNRVFDPKGEPRRPFSLFLEESREIIWWLNSRGESISVSPVWMEFTGQTVEEGIGMGYFQVIHPEDRKRVIEGWNRASVKKECFEVEYRLRRRDGVWRHVLSRGLPISGDPGAPSDYVGTCVDITARKEAESALREEARRNEQDRAQLAAVFQAMSDSVFVFDMDARLLFVNDAEAVSTGYRNAEGPSQEVSESVAKDPAGPQDAPFHAVELKNLDGTPLPGEEWPHVRVLEGISENNRELLVEHRRTGVVRRVSFTIAPVRNGEGKQVLGLIIARDVTLAREAEEKLRESEEWLRTMADNVAQMIWMADARGRPFWGNRRWLKFVGCELSEMDETMWRKTVAPDHFERVRAKLCRSVETGEPFEDIIPMHGSDGEYRWFLTRAIPLRDASGKVFRWFGSNTDITEQRRIQEELREADRRKSEFLGVLSHELRNPLAPIRNSIYLLRRGPRDSAKGERAIEVIDRQTEHLARLVDDLLDVTRISRGKVELLLERVDLREIVRSTCDDLRSVFTKQKIALYVDIPSQPIWVDADRTRIGQAIGNLLQNAGKFTHAAGRVDVRATVGEGKARVMVRDTGIGIGPEDLARLFTPFEQARQNLARTQGGLGLGLALVKGFLDLHGGSVHATSAGLGKGSEFTLELQVADAAASTALVPGTAAAREEAAPPHRHTILVIEDNMDAGESLAEVLELSGHEVNLARDGQSGLAMARSLKPDVIVCDIGLPDLDGYQVARELRSDEDFQDTLLIALTGYAQPEDRQRARDAGFDEHLPKPPPLDALSALVASR